MQALLDFFSLHLATLILALPLSVFSPLLRRVLGVALVSRLLQRCFVQLLMKLDRKNRTASTRILRGVFMLGIWLSCALLVAYVMSEIFSVMPGFIAPYAQIVLLAALLDVGRLRAVIGSVKSMRDMPLSLKASKSLSILAGHSLQTLDNYGARRLLVELSCDAVINRVMGTALMYLLGGWTALFVWLSLQIAIRAAWGHAPDYYGFFWAWQGVWRLQRAIITLPVLLCLPIAACVVPKASPWRALRALMAPKNMMAAGFMVSAWFLDVLSRTSSIALGGPVMVGRTALARVWLGGDESAKLEETGARCAIMLMFVSVMIAALVIAFVVTAKILFSQ